MKEKARRVYTLAQRTSRWELALRFVGNRGGGLMKPGSKSSSAVSAQQGRKSQSPGGQSTRGGSRQSLAALSVKQSSPLTTDPKKTHSASDGR